METTEATTEAPAKPRGRPGFGGGKKGVLKPPQVLSDMRAVYRQTPEQDRNGGQKALRKLLDEDPKGFIGQLGQLERQWAARRDGKKAQQAAVSDEAGEVQAATLPVESDDVAGDAGEERVTELIERLLGEWEHAD